MSNPECLLTNKCSAFEGLTELVDTCLLCENDQVEVDEGEEEEEEESSGFSDAGYIDVPITLIQI